MNLAIVVTGDRNWTDKDLVMDTLKQYTFDKYAKIVLINGDCRGLDKIAGQVGKELGFEVIGIPAKWKLNGLMAGPIRNKEMIDRLVEYKENGYQTIVIAFHDNLESSKGTKDCVKHALNAEMHVLYVSH